MPEATPLLLHYHFFKNAGTSIEQILLRNFGERWIPQEFPAAPTADHRSAVSGLVRERSDVRAISSHTLRMPLPVIEDVTIVPIVFLRHPLDRAYSAYLYHRRAGNPAFRSTLLARTSDFGGYVRGRLGDPADRSITDFQTWRLAMAVPGMEGDDRVRAFAALDSLPFVGLVEAFDQSVAMLEKTVRPLFPNFRVFSPRANSSQPVESTLAERLAALRARLRTRDFAALVAANTADLALHARMAARYGIDLPAVA
jgi:hypothetical protein